MSKGKFSVTMLGKYESMIKDRFAPVIAAAERATAPLRFSIQEEIKKEWGIYKLQQALAVANEKVKSLESEIKARTGKACNGYSSYDDVDKIDIETERRLRERDGICERITTEQKELIDNLWLAQAPDELVRIIKSIDVTGYMAQVKELEATIESMGLKLLKEE